MSETTSNIIDLQSLKLSNIYSLKKQFKNRKYAEASFKCEDKTMITDPYPHQKLIEYYMNRFEFVNLKGLLVFHGLGSGKTCASIIAAAKNKIYKHIIIFLPAFLKPNYITEIKEKCLQSKEGTQYLEEENIKLFSYNSTTIPMKICKEYIKDMKDVNFDEKLRTPDGYYQLMDKLISNLHNLNKNIFIVIDEAHHIFQTITNFKLKITTDTFTYSLGRFFYDFFMRLNCKILFLTGTPLTNYAYEAAVIGNLCHGYVYPQSRSGTLFPENPEVFYQTYIDQKTNKLSSFKRDEFTRKFFGIISYFPNIENIEVFPELNSNTSSTQLENQSYYQKYLFKSENIDLNLDRISDIRLRFEVHQLPLLTKENVKSPNVPTTQYDIYNEYFKKEEEEMRKSKRGKKVQKTLSFMRSENDMSSFHSNTRIASNFVFPEHYFYMILIHIYLFCNSITDSKKILSIQNVIVGGKIMSVNIDISIVFNQLQQNFIESNITIEELYKILEQLYQIQNITDYNQIQPIRNVFGTLISQYNYIAPSNFRKSFCPKVDRKLSSQYHTDFLRCLYYFIELNNEYPKSYSKEIQYTEKEKIKNYDILLSYFRNELLLETFSVKYLELKRLLNDIHEKKEKPKGKYRKKLIYSFYKNQAGTTSIKWLLNSIGYQQYITTNLVTNNTSNNEFAIINDLDIDMDIETSNTTNTINNELNAMNNTAAALSSDALITKQSIIQSSNPNIRKFVIFEGDNIQRKDAIKQFNSNPEIDIIIISTAGSEGISLKNVRDVFIMEPYWNINRITQVIGRARRICSHKNLPISERYVKVYKFMSILPNDMRSTDLIIDNLSKNKKYLIDDISSVFESIAIDCPLLENKKKKICYADTFDFSSQMSLNNLKEYETSKNMFLYQFYIDKKSSNFKRMENEILELFVNKFSDLIKEPGSKALGRSYSQIKEILLIDLYNTYIQNKQSETLKLPKTIEEMYAYIVYPKNIKYLGLENNYNYILKVIQNVLNNKLILSDTIDFKIENVNPNIDYSKLLSFLFKPYLSTSSKSIYKSNLNVLLHSFNQWLTDMNSYRNILDEQYPKLLTDASKIDLLHDNLQYIDNLRRSKSKVDSEIDLIGKLKDDIIPYTRIQQILSSYNSILEFVTKSYMNDLKNNYLRNIQNILILLMNNVDEIYKENVKKIFKDLFGFDISNISSKENEILFFDIKIILKTPSNINNIQIQIINKLLKFIDYNFQNINKEKIKLILNQIEDYIKLDEPTQIKVLNIVTKLVILLLMNFQIQIYNILLKEYYINTLNIAKINDRILKIYYEYQLNRIDISSVLNYKLDDRSQLYLFDYIPLKTHKDIMENVPIIRELKLYLAIDPNPMSNRFYLFGMGINENEPYNQYVNKIFNFGEILHYQSSRYFISFNHSSNSNFNNESDYEIDIQQLITQQTLQLIDTKYKSFEYNMKFILENSNPVNYPLRI
jgi:hypothetical protein